MEQSSQLPAQSKQIPHVFRHVHWNGRTYYLHRSCTGKGGSQYRMTSDVRAGQAAELPAGFEVIDSMSGGGAFVCKIKPQQIPASDLALVRSALDSTGDLQYFFAEIRDEAIVIHEPRRWRALRIKAAEARVKLDPSSMARLLGPRQRGIVEAHDEEGRALIVANYIKSGRFDAVMRFVYDPGQPRYVAERKPGGGNRSWSPLAFGGEIDAVIEKYLPLLVT